MWANIAAGEVSAIFVALTKPRRLVARLDSLPLDRLWDWCYVWDRRVLHLMCFFVVI